MSNHVEGLDELLGDDIQVQNLIDQDRERETRLRRLGIYTPDTLSKSVKGDAKQPYLIEGLLRMTYGANMLRGWWRRAFRCRRCGISSATARLLSPSVMTVRCWRGCRKRQESWTMVRLSRIFQGRTIILPR